ncbi:beta-L-arabinofuranosidase domain-containing protein [Streptomyces spiralis]|uniref:beta-L-arabinofuranosidase domain-containing protein n=1 Tax=Streptomyces spiralis TaxID=66376 RepID=UPI001E4A17E5|nr:beta-L-arabinofuranosidase domain-containing protein [Streptomyces spiralis]
MASFEAAVANEDTLDGEHANQPIPQYQGYLEIYEQTGEQQYFTAARNFWDMVVPHRTYVDGGMAGSGEIFGARNVIARTIQKSNAETCCVYNMLKPSRSLFFHTADPKYMQYYERALYGQILAPRRNMPFHIDTTDSHHMYFKRAEPEIVFGDTATGIENRPGADGLTFLDEVWDQGPFQDRGGLVRAVTRVADPRTAAGELTERQRAQLIEAAARAHLPA